MRFFNNRFPYTTINDINLDWIIKKVKALMADVEEVKTTAETAQTTAENAEQTAAGKQDAPTNPGEVGQVLGLDAELRPVWVDQTGGGGGTNNYNSLTNKPSINGVTLAGNKTAVALGLATVDALNSVDNTALTALSQSAEAASDASDAMTAAQAAQSAATTASERSAYAVSLANSAQTTANNVTASLATYVKPNLLDNWYFAGGGSQQGYGIFPVNQRGQTSYSNSDAYTIDRWKLVSGSLTVSSGGITLNGTIAQILPASVGLPVVASALLSDGTMITPTYNDSTKTFTLTATGQTIVAVKLEIGSTQDLAHQEGGTWVLNEIPDYAEQLSKCKLYYQVIKGNGTVFGSGICSNGSGPWSGAASPMASDSAVRGVITGSVYVATLTHVGSGASPTTDYDASLTITGVITGYFRNVTDYQNGAAMLQFRDSSSKIEFSAEL